jgi:hypothetical protein
MQHRCVGDSSALRSHATLLRRAAIGSDTETCHPLSMVSVALHQ